MVESRTTLLGCGGGRAPQLRLYLRLAISVRGRLTLSEGL
jgi:hypothetical protein